MVDPYLSSYSEYYNAITELTTLIRVNLFPEPAHALHSSRVLMLHKSSTYCLRKMFSSSLIFSMGAISMKVNPAFVFILIIASSLAIHLSTYIQPSHRLWGWALFMALTPSPRCLHPLSCGGLISGSFHGLRTFS